MNMYTGKRLLSLDALRGFDMMFIMGVSTIIERLCALFNGGENCWLARQMSHVPWNGLRHHDTIFPLFLFIAGIAFTYSYAKQVANGASKGRIHAKIFKRGLALFLLGLVYNGLFDLDFANLRFCSVLARIGFAWMFAALLFVNLKPKARIWISCIILVGYYLLIRFVGAPDYPGADPLSMEGNLVGYIDRLVMKNHLYYKGVFDPEGILSILPAVVTAMLGMFTGEFIQQPESRMSGGRKTVLMFAAAAVMLVAGLLWSLDFPINKALWSSTFILVVGAYSLAMFALFYYLIDVKGWRRWATFFEVIGRNPISIYMVQRFVSFWAMSQFFFGGLAGLCSQPVGDLILAVGKFGLCWLFLWFLYRKKIYWRV